METKFTPIAMRCTQEQFEAIKPKFKNTKWKVLSDIMVDFKVDEYLVNNFRKNKIVNIYETCKANHGRTVYETWDEATFLRACGIEVDEPLTVSKDFILELHNEVIWPSVKAKIEKEFPELFEPKLEVGKWYKSNKVNIIVFRNNDANNYGIYYSEWRTNLRCSDVNEWKLATPEEVETALINEAKKRGFKEGITYDCNGVRGRKDKVVCGKLIFKYWDKFDSGFGIHCTNDGWIFWNGKWAEIIEQPTEMTVAEIEEKLGFKIKIVK